MVPGSPCSPSFQQSRAAARTHCSCPVLAALTRARGGRSGEMMEFASLAFFGCCCSQTLVNSLHLVKSGCYKFVSLSQKKRKVASPAGRGAAHHTQEIILSLNLWLQTSVFPKHPYRWIYVEMVQQRNSARGGSARGSLPLLPPRGFRAVLWRGC